MRMVRSCTPSSVRPGALRLLNSVIRQVHDGHAESLARSNTSSGDLLERLQHRHKGVHRCRDRRHSIGTPSIVIPKEHMPVIKRQAD